MKACLFTLFLSCASVMAEEGLRSGHATAQWLVGDAKFGEEFDEVGMGGFINTVIRLQVDEHWHTYWLNPGDAGMPTSLELKLPEGWEHLGLAHPVPKKFKTGGLHGFGHEGTVDYCLVLLAPENFKGNAELVATVSWLTCNDESCIPGEITLKLKVLEGKVVGARLDPEAVKSATEKLPLRMGEVLKLSLKDGGEHWDLSLAGQFDLDPGKAEVFIETPELVPASAEVKFKKVGERWEAKAPKGEFAPEKPEECAILLVQEGKRAVRVEWKPAQ